MPSSFISHVSEDSEAVHRIAAVLQEFDVTIWLDQHSLKPGLRWQDQIRHSISGGDFFIACFSEAYVNRTKTYMNEELTLAIQELRQRPGNRAWFLPVKLNAWEIADRSIGAGETLRSIQWVDIGADFVVAMEKISVYRWDNMHDNKCRCSSRATSKHAYKDGCRQCKVM
jgi:hypothetical protein